SAPIPTSFRSTMTFKPPRGQGQPCAGSGRWNGHTSGQPAIKQFLLVTRRSAVAGALEVEAGAVQISASAIELSQRGIDQVIVLQRRFVGQYFDDRDGRRRPFHMRQDDRP